MSGVLIHIVSYAGEEPTPFDDQYVVDYDPGKPSVASDGTELPFTLVTTPDKTKARAFADMNQAFECWRKSHGTRPWDGQPNRPMTAWHVEFEGVPS